MRQQLQSIYQSKTDIIFDFDRTLAQIEIDWANWHIGVAEIYSKYDEHHGYEQGKNPHEYYNDMAERYGQDLVREVKKFVEKYEEENSIGYTPNTELISFVKKNKNKNLHIFSSNAKKTVVRGLQELDVLDCFVQIVTRDDISLVKPNPQGFYLFEGFEKNKNSFVMIGDSTADELAANSANVDFIKCTYF